MLQGIVDVLYWFEYLILHSSRRYELILLHGITKSIYFFFFFSICRINSPTRFVDAVVFVGLIDSILQSVVNQSINQSTRYDSSRPVDDDTSSVSSSSTG